MTHTADPNGPDDRDGPGGATTFGIRAIGAESDGATSPDEDDLAGLIPDFVATRADLNLVEYENISRAVPWARTLASNREPRAILEHGFVFELHERMFCDVWRWAGTQRRRETSIGVDPSQISEQTRNVLDDAVYRHEQETHPPDGVAARLHARLVAVHPFRNGNGRCTRLVADLYLHACGEPGFTWGGRRSAHAEGETRALYLDALHAADAGDFEPLVAFARS